MGGAFVIRLQNISVQRRFIGDAFNISAWHSSGLDELDWSETCFCYLTDQNIEIPLGWQTHSNQATIESLSVGVSYSNHVSSQLTFFEILKTITKKGAEISYARPFNFKSSRGSYVALQHNDDDFREACFFFCFLFLL